MEIAFAKVLSELPLTIAIALIILFLTRELLRYLKSRDTINGKTHVAKIELDTEVEITQRGTTNELFALFREQSKFNTEAAQRDEEYRKSSLKAQYDTIAAIRSTERSIEILMDNVMLPEKRIIEAFNTRIENMKNSFLAYHDENKEEILNEIRKITKVN